MNILSLFCETDDFCKVFEQFYQTKALTNGKSRNRKTRLAQSEVMTILVMYHASGYKNLKALGNVASGLIAYCWKEKKPSLNLNFKDLVWSYLSQLWKKFNKAALNMYYTKDHFNKSPMFIDIFSWNNEIQVFRIRKRHFYFRRTIILMTTKNGAYILVK